MTRDNLSKKVQSAKINFPSGNPAQVCLSKYDNVTCANLTVNEEAMTAVQRDTSFWIWSSTLCMMLPSIFADCFLGAWSDAFGRKYTLLMPPIGALVATIIYIIKGDKIFDLV
jgi:hypothetical protein